MLSHSWIWASGSPRPRWIIRGQAQSYSSFLSTTFPIKGVLFLTLTQIPPLNILMPTLSWRIFLGKKGRLQSRDLRQANKLKKRIRSWEKNLSSRKRSCWSNNFSKRTSRMSQPDFTMRILFLKSLPETSSSGVTNSRRLTVSLLKNTNPGLGLPIVRLGIIRQRIIGCEILASKNDKIMLIRVRKCNPELMKYR